MLGRIAFTGEKENEINVYNHGAGKVLTFQNDKLVYSAKINSYTNKLYYLQLSDARFYSELWVYDFVSKKKLRITNESYGDVSGFSEPEDGGLVAFVAFHDARNEDAVFLVNLNDEFQIIEIGFRQYSSWPLVNCL